MPRLTQLSFWKLNFKKLTIILFPTQTCSNETFYNNCNLWSHIELIEQGIYHPIILANNGLPEPGLKTVLVDPCELSVVMHILGGLWQPASYEPWNKGHAKYMLLNTRAHTSCAQTGSCCICFDLFSRFPIYFRGYIVPSFWNWLCPRAILASCYTMSRIPVYNTSHQCFDCECYQSACYSDGEQSVSVCSNTEGVPFSV